MDKARLSRLARYVPARITPPSHLVLDLPDFRGDRIWNRSLDMKYFTPVVTATLQIFKHPFQTWERGGRLTAASDPRRASVYLRWPMTDDSRHATTVLP